MERHDLSRHGHHPYQTSPQISYRNFDTSTRIEDVPYGLILSYIQAAEQVDKLKAISFHTIGTTRDASYPAPTTSTGSRHFPMPSNFLRKHERQNNLIQHLHSSRLDFKLRLPPLPQVAPRVELGHHRLLVICGDQLQNRGPRSASGVPGRKLIDLPWGNSAPPHPSPTCTQPRLVR